MSGEARDGAWLTAREAGAVLGLAEQSILRGIADGRFQAERVPTPHGPAWLVWVIAGWSANEWDTALARESEAAQPVTRATADSPSEPAPAVLPDLGPSPLAPQRPGPGRHERTFAERIQLGASKLHIPVEEYRAHIEAGERWCTACKAWHPADDMVRSGRRPHGSANICRAAARQQYSQRQAAKKMEAVR